MQDLILVVNSGSSSIKFSAYVAIDKEEAVLLLKGQVEGVGAAPHMIAKNEKGAILAEKRWASGAVSAPASRITVWVIPTDEERTIVRQTYE